MKERFLRHFTTALKAGDIEQVDRLITYIEGDRKKYIEMARIITDGDLEEIHKAYQFATRKKGYFSSAARDRLVRFMKSLEKSSYVWQMD